MKLEAPGGDVQVTTRDGINTLWSSDLPDPDSIQPDIVGARRSDAGFVVCGGKRLDVEFRVEYDGRGLWAPMMGGVLPWRLTRDMCLDRGNTIKLRRRWTALPTCDGDVMPEHSEWVGFEFQGDDWDERRPPFYFQGEECIPLARKWYADGKGDDWLRWLKAVDATDADVTPMTRGEALALTKHAWNGWNAFYVAMGNYEAAKEVWEYTQRRGT